MRICYFFIKDSASFAARGATKNTIGNAATQAFGKASKSHCVKKEGINPRFKKVMIPDIIKLIKRDIIPAKTKR